VPEVSGLWRTPSSALGLQCGVWPEKRAKAPVLRKVNKMQVSKTLPVQIQIVFIPGRCGFYSSLSPFRSPRKSRNQPQTTLTKCPTGFKICGRGRQKGRQKDRYKCRQKDRQEDRERGLCTRRNPHWSRTCRRITNIWALPTLLHASTPSQRPSIPPLSARLPLRYPL